MLSIIVPVYNVKNYLVRCLDSISNQTFKDFEVIIVDDGSTDGSEIISDNYCADRSLFRVYHKKNGGLMSAWKYGVERSRGEYIGFVDSDDYIDACMYEKMMQHTGDSNVDIVLCNHYYVNSETNQMTVHRNPIKQGVYFAEELNGIKKCVLPRIGTDYISPSRCTKVIKKNLLVDMLKFTDDHITSAEDVCSMDPCLLNCHSLAYVDEPLYYYVFRSSSISNVFREEVFQTYGVLINKLKEAADEAGVLLELSNQLENLYNFYGLLWAEYIRKSNLSALEKRDQFNRLLSCKNYTCAVHLLRGMHSSVAWIYRAACRTKMPWIYFGGMRLHGFLRRLFKR